MPTDPDKITTKTPRRPRGARIESNRCAIRAESLNRIPWIEFLAAGISKSSAQPTGWLAFITSHLDFVKSAVSSSNRPTNEVWRLVSSKRVETIRGILHELDQNYKSSNNDLICDLPEDLHTLAHNYFADLFSKTEGGTEGITKPEPVLIS